jgi:hypothetical protein
MVEERLFSIGEGCTFEHYERCYAGRAADGRQALIGWCSSLGKPFLLLWFDADGRFLGTEMFGELFRDMSPTEAKADYDQARAYYDQCRAFLLGELAARAAELGIRPGPIRVRHFYTEEPFLVAIRLLPQAALDMLCHPYSFPCPSFDHIVRDIQSIKDGVASGEFNLFWGEEWFRFDKDGRHDGSPPTVHHVEPDRVYTLRDCPREENRPGYATGRLPDGSQAILGQFGDNHLLVRFDRDGHLVGSELRAIPEGRPAEQEATKWRNTLRWQSGPIRVRNFMVPDHPAYIAEGPEEVIIGKWDPYYFPDPEVRQRLLGDVARWEAEGNFVLNWADSDYYLGPDGRPLPD